MEVEVYWLAHSDRALATRSKGKELVQSFREVFESTTADTMVVAWDGVKAASPSFTDEFVGRLHDMIIEAPIKRTVVFSGDDPYVMDLVDTILRRREFPVEHFLSVDRVGVAPCGMLGHPAIPKVVPA